MSFALHVLRCPFDFQARTYCSVSLGDVRGNATMLTRAVNIISGIHLAAQQGMRNGMTRNHPTGGFLQGDHATKGTNSWVQPLTFPTVDGRNPVRTT